MRNSQTISKPNADGRLFRGQKKRGVNTPDISRSIFDVPTDGMCTGCGVCAGICPTKAIEMELSARRGVYVPKVSPDLCTNCELCRQVCPPLTWDNRPPDHEQWHPSLGTYQEVLAAQASDAIARRQSSSGGFVTALLTYLLAKGMITGAVVTRRCSDDPLRSEVILAKTEDEIVSARGSKYSPVNFDQITRVLRKLDPARDRVAVVGLPCHVEGIFQCTNIGKSMRRVIKYQISLVCGQSPSLRAYDFILRRLGVASSDVRDLSNRGDGWPGSMTVVKRDGSSIKVPYTSNLAMGMVLSSPVFTPMGCQLCADPVGFRADLTVADAWLKRFAQDDSGVSLVLLRNPELIDVTRRMAQEGLLAISESSAGEFLEANRRVMDQKSVNRPLGIRWLLGKRASRYNRNIHPHSSGISWWKCLKLALFFQHVRFLGQLDLCQLGPWLSIPVLFYFKAVNLLKR